MTSANIAGTRYVAEQFNRNYFKSSTRLKKDPIEKSIFKIQQQQQHQR